jgi:hypothetical protein
VLQKIYILKGVNFKKRNNAKLEDFSDKILRESYYFRNTSLGYMFTGCTYDCIISDYNAMAFATSDWCPQQVNIKASELCKIAKTLLKTSNFTHSS